MPPPGAPALLRRHNAALVMSVLFGECPLTRAEIARRAMLSKPTINEVVNELIDAGFVEEVAAASITAPGRMGRRGRPIAVRGDGGYLVGVDIGAHKIQTLVSDLTGAVVAADRRVTSHPERPQVGAILEQTRESVLSALQTAGVGWDVVRAMGVGTPGDVDPTTGRLSLVPQIEGFDGLDLRAALQSWVPCPIYVDNEVHLAVLGERWRGAARGIDDAVLLNVGIGVAAGILIGGALHRGSTGAAGEIGYLPLDDDWARRGDLGRWGALEYEAGGAAYARLARAAVERPEGAALLQLADGHPERLDAEAVFGAAHEGDPEARRIVDRLVGLLARSVASLDLVLDPSTIVLAGGIARAGADLLEPLAQRVNALVPRPPRMVLTELGDDAVPLGAIFVAREAAWAPVRVSPFGDLGA